MNWNEFLLALEPFDEGYGEPTYAVEGVLRWFLTQSLPNDEDSKAIVWFHRPYRRAYRDLGITEGSIYHTAMTGRVNQISRLWHRMYPKIRFIKDPTNPKKPVAKPTNFFFELLTIFPDNSPRSKQFLEFLESDASTFQKLW